jgi:hypothetical protein
VHPAGVVGMESELEPQPQLGARVSAEIGRLESLLARVGAEFSDDEDDEEDGGVLSEGSRIVAGQAEPLPVPDVFAHRTEPRPCAPFGARSSCAAVLPTKPRTPQQVGRDVTEGASPRQRNVYTRATAAAVSAQCGAATHLHAFNDESNGSSLEAVLSRNIAEARHALGELERYVHHCSAITLDQSSDRCSRASGDGKRLSRATGCMQARETRRAVQTHVVQSDEWNGAPKR